MRATGWAGAAAAGALFVGGLTLALGLKPPSASSVTLDQNVWSAPVATEPLQAEAEAKAATTTTTSSGIVQPTNITEPEDVVELAIPVPKTPDVVARPITGDVAVAHSVGDGCDWKQVEWHRREEAGDIDWDRMFPDDEVDDPESVWLEPLPFDGGVQTDAERIALPDFSTGLDVGTLSNRALLSAIEVCDEAGLLEE